MNVELTRFKVKEGKSYKVDKWMKLLNDRMGEVLLTLQGEKIYVETIFREVVKGEEFLYWYHVQGEGGIDVTESDHAIDHLHLEYWDECIDPNYEPVDLHPEVIMIPDKVRETMK
ncbi:DUF6176 family protein [Pontibacillus marinus]|uniref:Uncharacterized protein n=1 Tax=Pontibacillus marinus BH030004 = DSM 16465 TaxID=1385511 RepID=A0A0A5I231_9BACI|nr:DUF6176 family protein [Pontibacillus marinus]KGX89907.1 hypothetical protein N783_03410 [Pontibacillus marinus BH030004 = DSM 16465]